MSDDIVIGVAGLPVGMPVSKKPSYLITLEGIIDGGKTKVLKRFITLDKPELLNGFVQAKGFYCELSESEIVKSYTTLLTTVDRELILETMLPWHKISNIRSLVFKAK